MTIGSIVGHPSDPRTLGISPLLVDNTTFLGVEIELEDVRYFDHKYFKESPFWTLVDEPSLRNSGREYITGVEINGRHFPIRGKDLIDTLEYFDNAISKYHNAQGKYPEVSKRTSIHIHVDVRELSYKQLVNYILLYVIFESVFFSIFGDGREKSPYCSSISRNHEAKMRLVGLLKSNGADNIYRTLMSGSKYDACNILSIHKTGSLEFRLHEGTFKSEEILNWINLLLLLKKKATQTDFSIKDLPQQASELGMLEFLKSIFGEYSENILVDVVERDILQGIRITQDILIHGDLQKSHKAYNASKRGENAKDSSILHSWAKTNNRSIFIENIGE